MTHSNESQLDDILDSMTDAILSSDRHDISKLMQQYDMPVESLGGLLDVIRQLKTTFVRQQPSDQFVQELKRDLIGQRENVLSRVRYLPGRVQIAAGLAVVAGFLLINRRRLVDEQQENNEVAILQQ